MTLKKIPTLFISHGPPFLAISDDPAPRFWETLSHTFERPSAIVCASAHWETLWPMVTTSEALSTIHDFSGPSALFSIEYPVASQTKLAEEIVRLCENAGLKAVADLKRGIDHGVWVPLLRMFPDADIPVVQLSIQTDEDPAHHLKLGEILSPLRDQNVLIIGSGGATHNLPEVHNFEKDAAPPGYAADFDRWLHEKITDGDVTALADYKRQGPEASTNHPWPAEHFLPLFVAMGAAGNLKGRCLHQGFMYGVLSMAAYAWD